MTPFASVEFDRPSVALPLAAAGMLTFLMGLYSGTPALLAAGAAGACLFVRDGCEHTRWRWRLDWLSGASESRQLHSPLRPKQAPASGNQPRRAEEQHIPESIRSTEDLVEALIATGRHALLLRPEVSGSLTPEQFDHAVRALDETMALIPAGRVLLGQTADRATLGIEAFHPKLDDPTAIAEVCACYIDRCCVTNAQYQHFIDSGGYELLEFWPEEALPAMFDFVDSTGQPGPHGWREGVMPEGQEELPVTGISWYEAQAYARWVGKRLPSDAEWTKAGAWPVEAAPGRIAQRRYPWGESFDSKRANLWCARIGGPEPVDSRPEGVSVGGIYQLIGNVWEWTSTPLADLAPRGVEFSPSLRTVRGGAFNTYFENQATCHFQSAEHPLARRANIGVRLALSMESLTAPHPDPVTAEGAQPTQEL